MEKKKYTVLITGTGAEEALAKVEERLSELETPGACSLEIILGKTLEQNADFVYSMGIHDAPEFAAEKILDQLAERGWISLETGVLSPEEEAQIHARLQGLGYVD